MSWRTAKIGDLLATVKRAGKLQATQYQESGRFPVIDQGQSDIAGYSDNSEIVHIGPLPIVIFGDHTRRVKLAREPFICGADGTQLLYPKDDDLDPVFFYHALKNVDLSNYAYARHFKFLKDQELTFPDLPTQTRIASILSAYDDLIENNRRRIGLLEQAARLLYREWFVHLRFPGHETAKFIDGLPEGWQPAILSDYVTLVKDAVQPSAFKVDDIHIGLEHIPRRSFVLSEWESTDGLESHKFRFVSGDIIFGKIRPYFHKVGFALRNGLASSDAFVWRVTDLATWCMIVCATSSDHFVSVASKTVREGSKMPRADWGVLANYSIPRPPNQLLSEFDGKVRPITDECRSLALQIRSLTRARDLLLPRLIDGRIPV